jgi:epoxyqueuosine reductase
MDSDAIKQWGQEGGFDLVGIAPAETAGHQDYFREWLRSGCHGGMAYLAREPDKRVDPRKLLPWARSVICVAANYYPGSPTRDLREKTFGRVARYAWGRDYHQVIKERLHRLAERIQKAAGRGVQSRCFVDTGPIMEKQHSARAGLGWIGKNTLLLNEKFGSWLALGEIVTDLELECDRPVENRCGDCRRCVEACPTGALTGPYQLDARRCISYLTIETGAEIPREFAAKMGNWFFGCDVCQEACPYNPKAVPTNDPDFAPRENWRRLNRQRILTMTEEQFKAEFDGGAILRAGLTRLRALAQILKRG